MLQAVADAAKDKQRNRYRTAAQPVLPTQLGSGSTGQLAMEQRRQQLEDGIKHVRGQLLDFRLNLSQLSGQELMQILEERDEKDQPMLLLRQIRREKRPLSVYKQALIRHVLLGEQHADCGDSIWQAWMQNRMPSKLDKLGTPHRNRELHK